MDIRGLLMFISMIILLTALAIPVISSQPPSATQVILNLDSGLNIEVPRIETFKQNENFSFSFHVYNITTGQRIDNITTNCTFELFNDIGEHIFEKTNLDFVDDEWEILVTGGNFSEVGEYYYITDCSSEGDGGVISVHFMVSTTGRDFSTAQGNVSSAILIGALGLSFLFLIFGIKLGQNDATATIGFFFMIFSLIFGVYSLHLSYVYANDIIQYSSLTPVTSGIYIAVLFSLTFIILISAALMAIAMIKQLSVVVKKKKFGDDFNPITDTYE